jgi:hypothetical protein
MVSDQTTSRPWEVRKDHLSSWWITDLAERRVAYIGHESDARADGDARLIVEAVNALREDAP